MKYTDAIRAHDLCDVLVGMIEKGESSLREDRAGAPAGLSPSVSSKAAHRISQEPRERGVGNGSPSNT
jgi:hypothetical protein